MKPARDSVLAEPYMRLAIAKAREGIGKGQTPFGACIVLRGRVVACAHNRVWSGTDITAHAEITAIRIACRKLKTVDLSGAVIYSTCEPCPMCFAASHWARISTVIYGAAIADAAAAGFNELAVSNRRLARLGGSPVRVESGFLAAECRVLFGVWKGRRFARKY